MKDSPNSIQDTSLFILKAKESEMNEDRVVYNYVTGKPGDVVSIVVRKISAHTRDRVVRWFRIGITNYPERRFNRHKGLYDKMKVIYRSTSLESVRELERELIEHNKELADNFIGGGGGRIGEPPYFMYVVVRYW